MVLAQKLRFSCYPKQWVLVVNRVHPSLAGPSGILGGVFGPLLAKLACCETEAWFYVSTGDKANPTETTIVQWF